VWSEGQCVIGSADGGGTSRLINRWREARPARRSSQVYAQVYAPPLDLQPHQPPRPAPPQREPSTSQSRTQSMQLTLAVAIPSRHSPRTTIHHQQDEQCPAHDTAETDPDAGSCGELVAGRTPVWLFCTISEASSPSSMRRPWFVPSSGRMTACLGLGHIPLVPVPPGTRSRHDLGLDSPPSVDAPVPGGGRGIEEEQETTTKDSRCMS
jgi:hypothetical protein